MARWRTKLTAVFSLKHNSTAKTGTTPANPLARLSTRNIRQGIETPGAVSSVPLPLASSTPSPTGPESIPTDNVNHTRTPVEMSAYVCTVLRWRTKVFPAIARKRTPIPGIQPSILPVPVHLSARYIGPALLASGLAAAAPLHAVYPPSAVFACNPGDSVDLSQAQSALRVLSALGDGVAGVPWLKGAAELGLEIANTLDVSRLQNW